MDCQIAGCRYNTCVVRYVAFSMLCSRCCLFTEIHVVCDLQSSPLSSHATYSVHQTCNQLTSKVDGGITLKLAQVVNLHLVCDRIIQHLPWQQWSLLNRFRTEQGHCGACRRKWRLTDTDLCPCGETQTMSHIVKSCPLTKLNGSLSRLHSADEDTVSSLTYYGI